MTGCNILKTAATNFFNMIVDNGYFKTIKICAMVHDELLIEYPKDMPWVCHSLETIMQDASRKFCKFATIPAVGEVADHWIH